MTVPPKRLRVLYVAGTGRSGTTLVSNAMGALPGAISVGEVRFLFARGLAHAGTCGCREPVTTCPVWAPALADVFGSVPGPAQARSLEARLAPIVRTRTVPRWLAGHPADDADELARLLGDILLAVASRTGSSLVVDSSKLPAYGALLTRDPRLDVSFVHVVRDPRAVAWSWQRRRASRQVAGFEEEMELISPLRATAMWAESTASTVALARRTTSPWHLVRYEEFVADPRSVMASLASAIGVTTDLNWINGSTITLPTNHAVAGNPNRVRHGEIQLRLDDQWRTTMPRLVQGGVGVATWPARTGLARVAAVHQSRT